MGRGRSEKTGEIVRLASVTDEYGLRDFLLDAGGWSGYAAFLSKGAACQEKTGNSQIRNKNG